jgi:hypothetical protein
MIIIIQNINRDKNHRDRNYLDESILNYLKNFRK